MTLPQLKIVRQVASVSQDDGTSIDDADPALAESRREQQQQDLRDENRELEARLVRAVQGGDSDAFAHLVHAYSQSAFGVAYRIMGHREDAEDAVQDAFMLVLDNISSFDSSRPFAPWFFRILRNQALNARRSRIVRSAEQLSEDRASNSVNVDSLAERSEFRERFRDAVGQLNDEQRTVVELHDVEGFKSAEIANALGMPASTVRWHLQTARRKLRMALAPFRIESSRRNAKDMEEQ